MGEITDDSVAVSLLCSSTLDFSEVSSIEVLIADFFTFAGISVSASALEELFIFEEIFLLQFLQGDCEYHCNFLFLLHVTDEVIPFPQ